MRVTNSVKARRAQKARQNRNSEVEVTVTKPFIGLDKPYYIAIHKGGYGISKNIAAAIGAAQKSVKAKSKPTQLLIYRSFTEVTPEGFVVWPNGEQPILVGLTNTHQLWEPKRSLERLTTTSIRKSFEWAEA